MAKPKQVDPWIRQAEADLAAARMDGEGMAECHQRYWLQQGYEKAIKALALILFRGTNEEDQALMSLLSHSPVKNLAKHLGTSKTTLPAPLTHRRLASLEREVTAFVRKLDNAKFLEKIDALEPTRHQGDPSYRYPFMRGGEYLAPKDFDDWDGYLGDIKGASAAVNRLLQTIKEERKTFARSPK